MSNGAQPQKKGLSPLAWIGIGCAGLLVIGVIATVAGVGFLAHKGKEFVEDFEGNPALGTAKLIAMADSNLEVISSDDDAQTVTFYKSDVDEEFTISFEDIENGNLSWTTDEGTFGVTTDAGSDSSDGTVTFSGPDGETTFNAGNSADTPDWILLPPGAQDTQQTFSVNTTEQSTGALSAKTDMSLIDLQAYYEEELENEGFEVSTTSFSSGGTSQVVVSGNDKAAGKVLNVTFSQKEGETVEVVIQYQGPGAG